MLENNPYYHVLYNKICNMDCGEIVLNHKNTEDKLKFEEHIKEWISIDEFRVWNFYIVFSENYDKLIKKAYPYNQMKYLFNLNSL